MLLTAKVLLTLLILQSLYTITMALPMSRVDECEDKKKVKKIITFPVYYPAFYYPVFYYSTMYRLQIIMALSASVLCYHRDYGQLIGPFNPSYIELATECEETNQNACLVIPTKKVCRERLKESLNMFMQIPWWYFYCQWVVTLPPAPTTKTSTIHPFYRKMLDELLQYKQNLKRGNGL